MSLTPKQQLFVAEYLKDLNATAAYQRAGYSAKGNAAEAGASRLLRNAKVAAAVAAAQAARLERTEVTADWVLAKLVENVERAMQAEPVRDREGNETGEFVYAGAVANKALELLGKHAGMFSENVNLRTPDGPLQVTVTRRIVRPG